MISRDGPDGLPPSPAVHRTHRQRRPTGAPPPLPHPFAVSTAAWLILAAVVLSGAILITQHSPSLRLDDRFSTWVLRQLAGIRTPWLTDVANGIKVAGSSWGVTVLGLATVALTMAFRRWRHLLVFVCSLFFLEVVAQWIYFGLSRPRPYGVQIIGSWGGYPAPSAPVAVLTIFLVGIAYCLIVPGRPRTYAKLGFTVLIALFCLARLYLGVDHPGDVLFGVALGVAIPVAAFRFFTPNEVFPVVYRRGRTAHVDVTGRRGEAIRQAVRDQLGLTVLEIKPVGLESSAGSTPLRLEVEGPDRGSVRVRQAVHQGSRSLRSLVQAVANHPLRFPGRRVTLQDRAAPGHLRGLCPAPAAGHRGPHGQALRHRRDHSRARVPAGHRVLPRCRGNRRGPRRRRADRPGTDPGPQAVGRGRRPPGHQTGQPDGPRRGTAADRRGLRPGPPFAVAAGGRPGQHDAGARGPQRSAARLPARPAPVHPGRARRGLRRHPRGGEPDATARVHETRSPRRARRIQEAGAGAAADHAAALECPADFPGRRACSP